MLRRIVLTTLAASVLIIGNAVAHGQVKEIPRDPSLKFQGLDGRVFDLSELHGSVVLVSFGATWCAPCTVELRALGELLNEYRNQPVKFFWVSIERPEEITNSDLKRYAKERKMTFPVLRDTDKMVFLQFTSKVRLPMTVMLTREGKIDAPVKFGMQSQVDVYKADIRARLNKLLATRSEGER